ncbi:MAG: transcriptional regulator GcvA [Alphaproteobacteria bacterium]|nr:transcriptional regulator GcvA [Alphaproteobacteria bacterium]
MKRTLPPFTAVRAFESAARYSSFKDAAEELNVTQSAISHQVKALEEFLGSALFHRGNKGVGLTPTGRAYFDDVTSILDQLDASTRRRRDCETDGPLNVRSTPAFAARWLVPKLNRFNSAYPDIELCITTTIATTDFRKDDVDVLLQYGQASASGLRVDSFLSSSRVPVCSPKMLEGAPPIQDPDDILRHTLLRDVVGDGWDDWFERAGVHCAKPPQGPHFEHCDLSLRAAEQGQGIALAYKALVADEIAQGVLVKLFEFETEPKVIYSVTCPKSWINRPKIAAFRNWLFEEAGEIDAPASTTPSESSDYIPALPYPN